mmetsp:Transcript_12750/g.19174  ORF Transcript_12750/g.19174 Transcript_12750/m.19174 type:complete len:265 (+) Transcript_12750:78-872(+)
MKGFSLNLKNVTNPQLEEEKNMEKKKKKKITTTTQHRTKGEKKEEEEGTTRQIASASPITTEKKKTTKKKREVVASPRITNRKTTKEEEKPTQKEIPIDLIIPGFFQVQYTVGGPQPEQEWKQACMNEFSQFLDTLLPRRPKNIKPNECNLLRTTTGATLSARSTESEEESGLAFAVDNFQYPSLQQLAQQHAELTTKLEKTKEALHYYTETEKPQFQRTIANLQAQAREFDNLKRNLMENFESIKQKHHLLIQAIANQMDTKS